MKARVWLSSGLSCEIKKEYNDIYECIGDVTGDYGKMCISDMTLYGEIVLIEIRDDNGKIVHTEHVPSFVYVVEDKAYVHVYFSFQCNRYCLS